jgi:hypothetical protein
MPVNWKKTLEEYGGEREIDELKITVWNIKNDNGAIIHINIENGWSNNDYPNPLKDEFKYQETRKNIKWNKKFAHLVNDVVVYI